MPDTAQLRSYTLAVARNNHLPLKSTAAVREEVRASAKELLVPQRIGDPSPIKHILYIIKENRTYDQFFGSLGKGNGEPSLNLYGDDVIPNYRALVRQYVLLDNFFATGGNSADGHQWVTQANETDYTTLPGDAGRSYPDSGQDPMAGARGGWIWNAAEAAHVSFLNFGEYACTAENCAHPEVKANYTRKDLLKRFFAGDQFENMFSAKSQVSSANLYLAPDYPGWTLLVPDVARARIFDRYLKKWEKEGEMPSLVMLQLPADHTAGRSPEYSDPQACTADKDYALGLIVESLSHSKFWASSLILVVEDDAQDGVDHVDGHRTVALAIGPYVKRTSIDSTFYSQPSMLKTIELILGRKNMSLFDEIANDMRASFTTTPDLTLYTAIKPDYSLFTETLPLKALSGQDLKDALASATMNFTIPDAAPVKTLNRIVWRSVRGNVPPYPKINKALFAPYTNGVKEDDDDDEKEEAHRGGR